jgi:predicted dehydrogenase
MIRVGICGFGYWGPNLARSFAANRQFRLTAIADPSPAAQNKARSFGNDIRVYDDAAELTDSGEVDAIAVATPVSTHYGVTARALKRGIHVLVEKPLAASVSEAEELVALAAAHRVHLLVDHVYLFHNAVLKLKQLQTDGTLGNISYYDSLRVNLGLFQPDMNVLWDLAPHDFSIIDHLFGEKPTHVEATGYCHVNAGLPDIVYVTLHFRSQLIAHLNLSWMSPVKVRRIAVGGSKKMVVWDDLNVEERLKIYSSGIEFQPEAQRSMIVPSYRIGDIYSPRLAGGEPLARVVDHFAGVISRNEASPIDARAGLRTVRLLDRAQRALDATFRTLGELAPLEAAK